MSEHWELNPNLTHPKRIYYHYTMLRNLYLVYNSYMPKKQRIKKLIVRRKEHFLTVLEKNWRDAALKPLTTFLWNIGLTANHITVSSFILLLVPIILHAQHQPLTTQLIILAIISLSDALDGPMARNNNNVTVFGTWMDHIRDGVLVLWASYLIYEYHLLSLEVLILIWALQLLLIYINLKDFIIKYLKGLPGDEEEVLVSNFSLDNLQASVIGRLQFFFWTAGYGFLLTAVIMSQQLLVSIGNVFIILEIIFAAFNILESYKKILPELP